MRYGELPHPSRLLLKDFQYILCRLHLPYMQEGRKYQEYKFYHLLSSFISCNLDSSSFSVSFSPLHEPLNSLLASAGAIFSASLGNITRTSVIFFVFIGSIGFISCPSNNALTTCIFLPSSFHSQNDHL